MEYWTIEYRDSQTGEYIRTWEGVATDWNHAFEMCAQGDYYMGAILDSYQREATPEEENAYLTEGS